MALRGIDYVIQVDDGGVYKTIAGQRGAALNVSTSEIDASTKDGAGWEEKLAGLRSWSIDFDGLHAEDDAALDLLEERILAGLTVNVRLQLPSGGLFSGEAIITNYDVDAAHDDLATASGTLTGTGALTKA